MTSNEEVVRSRQAMLRRHRDELLQLAEKMGLDGLKEAAAGVTSAVEALERVIVEFPGAHSSAPTPADGG